MLKTAETFLPDSLDAYIELGQTYSSMEQFERAEQVFDRALKLDPDASVVWYEIASVRESQKDIAGAEGRPDVRPMPSSSQWATALSSAALFQLLVTLGAVIDLEVINQQLRIELNTMKRFE